MINSNIIYKITHADTLSYSQLYEKIDKLKRKRINLYLEIVNLDELDDELEIEDINGKIESIDSYLEVFIYEMRVREEFIFNVFGDVDNLYEMCLN
jgi:hypothetical protein